MADLVVPKQIIPVSDIPAVICDPKPVIFWDTCSLLYYNTIIERRAYREYEKDYQLYDWIKNGSVYSVSSMVVLEEFNHHHKAKRDNDVNREQALKNVMKQYGDIFGSSQKEDLERGMNVLNLASHMEQMVSDLWANTYVINSDASLHEKAHKRCIGYLPPASVKSEYKDCYIWETFLAVCQVLPHKSQAFFITENTEDYCGNKQSRMPFTEIDSDAKRVQGNVRFDKHLLWVDIAKMLGII